MTNNSTYTFFVCSVLCSGCPLLKSFPDRVHKTRPCQLSPCNRTLFSCRVQLQHVAQVCLIIQAGPFRRYLAVIVQSWVVTAILDSYVFLFTTASRAQDGLPPWCMPCAVWLVLTFENTLRHSQTLWIIRTLLKLFPIHGGAFVCEKRMSDQLLHYTWRRNN